MTGFGGWILFPWNTFSWCQDINVLGITALLARTTSDSKPICNASFPQRNKTLLFVGLKIMWPVHSMKWTWIPSSISDVKHSLRGWKIQNYLNITSLVFLKIWCVIYSPHKFHFPLQLHSTKILGMIIQQAQPPIYYHQLWLVLQV